MGMAGGSVCVSGRTCYWEREGAFPSKCLNGRECAWACVRVMRVNQDTCVSVSRMGSRGQV